MFVKNIAILFSGNGSNLEAILNKVHNKTFKNTTIKCNLCISNKKDAYGIIRAKKFGLDTKIIENKNFKLREDFDKALVDEIQKHNIDLTILAGFMRILTPVFTSQIKAINIHPSILPLFKGANALQESFKSDMMIGGVSVHMVNEELDGGKIIAQETFKREKNMSLEKWEEKIHSLEHEILPQCVINLLAE